MNGFAGCFYKRKSQVTPGVLLDFRAAAPCSMKPQLKKVILIPK